VLYSDQLVTLDAAGTDAETAPGALAAAWSSSLDGALSTPAPDSEGRVLSAVTLSQGQHFLTFTVTDENGKSATDSVTVDVGPPNTPPSCAITAPEDGVSREVGAALTFRATVGDVDVPSDRLTVAWSSDKDGALGQSAPTTQGDVVFTTSVLSADIHTITLTVTDEVGGTCSDLVQVVLGTAPQLTLVAPLEGAVARASSPLAFEATVADAEDPPTAIAFTWTSSLQGPLSAQGADSNGRARFTRTDLVPGTHTLTVRATDPDGLFAEQQATFRVNAVPTAPGVTVSPAAPGTEAPLLASVTTPSVDADGDPVTYAWTWLKNGVATAFSGPSVPASATTKGETWTARATPSDGTHDGSAGEASVLIGNTAPDVTAVSVTPSSAPIGAVVTCAATASDPDETPTITYAWSLGGVPVATGPTYTLGRNGEVRGDTVVCAATARDGDGATDVGTASVTLTNTPPTLTSLSLAPLAPLAGDEVVCTALGAADLDGDPVSVSYAWTRNGRAAGSGATYAGELQSGDSLSCTATPSDGVANGTALSASVSVGNTAPELFGPVVTPASGPVGTVLTCAASASDVDGSNPVVTYRWTNAGVPVSTGATYTLAVTDDPGDVLTCTATADDGEGGLAAHTASATVENSAPVVASVVLTPFGPRTNDVLTATAAGSDANNQPLTWSYAFSVDGSVVQSGPSRTLDGALFFDKGDAVTVTATASDGAATGSATSAAVTILNTPPTAPTIRITPEAPVEGDALTCELVTPSLDADGDPLTYTYAWEVDGAVYMRVVDGTTSSIVPGVDVTADETWNCQLIVNDGSGDYSTAISVLIDSGCDVDGDGYRAEACGGDDCDDSNNEIFVRAGDVFGDGVDGDCDGLDCQAGPADDVYAAACSGGTTWSGAVGICMSAGYDGLFEPSTPSRDIAFQQLLDGASGLAYSNHWIGLSRGASSWQWSSGIPVTYASWSPSEPTGDGACVHYFGQADGRRYRWNDLSCSATLAGSAFGVFTMSPACMAP
jgi:hypothetical protein